MRLWSNCNDLEVLTEINVAGIDVERCKAAEVDVQRRCEAGCGMKGLFEFCNKHSLFESLHIDAHIDVR